MIFTGQYDSFALIKGEAEDQRQHRLKMEQLQGGCGLGKEIVRLFPFKWVDTLPSPVAEETQDNERFKRHRYELRLRVFTEEAWMKFQTELKQFMELSSKMSGLTTFDLIMVGKLLKELHEDGNQNNKPTAEGGKELPGESK